MQPRTLNKTEVIQLKKAWKDRFVPPKTYGIHLEQYLWHIFSWKVVRCEEGEQANYQFDKIRKSSFYVFYQHKDMGFLFENTESFKQQNLQEFQKGPNGSDIYVVDVDFSWTYVHTHEECCGPYFLKVPV